MVYSKDRLRAIDAGLLAEYFEKMDENKFKLKNSARSLVRFREHDVIKNTPFMHCGIILCRNLPMIYFNKQLQEEVLLKFYDCLNPGGFLVLGMVESLIGASVNAFEAAIRVTEPKE